MHYIGIDMHKEFLVISAKADDGVIESDRYLCKQTEDILTFFERHRPFKAVVEASSTYRWLYDLLSPLGEVVLAHPLRLRAIVAGRAKTDKLDAALLADLLRGNLIPAAYVPPAHYDELRQLTRARSRLARHMSDAKIEMKALLNRANVEFRFSRVTGIKAKAFIRGLDLGVVGNASRDEILRRLEHFERELLLFDEALERTALSFPETQTLTQLPGIGLFSALLIIGEIGEPERFADERKVGAYAGLTARVNQSGGHSYYGHITRQGSPWLRWVLVQSAMKFATKDERIRSFYTRIRKRSSSKIARVAAARKLAGICWIRLMKWHEQHKKMAAL